jgi:hypothetical protein
MRVGQLIQSGSWRMAPSSKAPVRCLSRIPTGANKMNIFYIIGVVVVIIVVAGFFGLHV